MTGRAIPTSASVILVAGEGGAFGNVLMESGVGKALMVTLETLHLPLVPAAFILSLTLRASRGSAMVAILTTSGLLTQAACFGGLGLSHVNVAGLRTWTMLTTLMGLSGFALTWLAWTLV